MSTTKFDITIDARMINHSGIGTYIKNLIPNLADHYKLAVLGNKNILATFIWAKKVKIVDANYPIYPKIFLIAGFLSRPTIIFQ